MQSGRSGRAEHWLIEGEALSPRTPEHLMGWHQSDDTNDQIKISFESKFAAVEFAENKGWDYDVIEDKARRVKPRNYLDNFKFRPIEYATSKPPKKK